MNQTRIDSVMEAVTNTAIGLLISTIANHFILPAVLGVSMTLGQNILIGLAFTTISVVRSYTLRRAFNGRTVWQAFSGWLFTPLYLRTPRRCRIEGFLWLFGVPFLALYGCFMAACDEVLAEVPGAYRDLFNIIRTGKV